MAILRTIVWFFYFFGALIVLTPKMNEAKRRWAIKDIKKALGDNMGVAKLPTIKVDGKDTWMPGPASENFAQNRSCS